MRREYVDRRGLYLIIIPYELDNQQANLRGLYEKAGLRWRKNKERTLYMSLKEPLEMIRGNISKNWRKNLNKAEKGNLEVSCSKGSELFFMVDQLCQELRSRKTWLSEFRTGEYENLQRILPENQKLVVFACQSENQPVAILVGSGIGDIGIELIAATGNAGLKLRGSYLLRWKMVEYLKEIGCSFYDLNGINPKRNPGGYQFKSGLCGKNGIRCKLPWHFRTGTNPLSYLMARTRDIIMSVHSSKLMNVLRNINRGLTQKI